MCICIAAQAQSGGGGQLPSQLLQLFQTLQNAQKQNSGQTLSPQSPVQGTMDTPENLDKAVKEARERARNSASVMGSGSWCDTAIRRPAHIPGSGYMELREKCAAALDADRFSQQSSAMQAEAERVAAERQRNNDARQRADDFEERRVKLLANLKAGAVAPKNCAQWIVGKGLDANVLRGTAVSRVAYRAPQGQGLFDARVLRIEGENLLAVVEEDHAVVIAISKSTVIFNEAQLRVGATVATVGTQTGTRTLKRSDGSTINVAVVAPTCLGASPNGLLDLMPE